MNEVFSAEVQEILREMVASPGSYKKIRGAPDRDVSVLHLASSIYGPTTDAT